MTIDVIHIINGLDVGGAERSLANLMRAGLSGDTRHGVISLQDGGAFAPDFEAANVPLWTLGMSPGKPSFTALRKLRAIVARANPKLLQGWMYHGNLAAAITRNMSSSRIKLTWNIRQTIDRLTQEKPLTRWVIRAHRLFAANVDSIIYNCATSQHQHERLGIIGRRVSTIANGVDADRFQPNHEHQRALRQQLGIPESATVIGHVARHHPIKDHATLLSALALVAKADPDAHFVLAGPGVNQQNQQLMGRSAAIGQQRLHLLGERNDMQRVFAGIDLLCLSSRAEGFPNVLLEAMASGIPCVTTDVGACAEIVGQTGRVVPANAPEALAAEMIALLQLPTGAKRQLRVAARQRVLDNYTIGAAVARYTTLYTSLLEG